MTKVLNLDALIEPPLMKITLGGQEHEMKSPTLGAMFQNIADVETAGMNPSLKTELEMVMAGVKRAFPTVTDAMLREMNMTQLKAVYDAVRGFGGEVVTEDAEEAKADTAPKGKS